MREYYYNPHTYPSREICILISEIESYSNDSKRLSEDEIRMMASKVLSEQGLDACCADQFAIEFARLIEYYYFGNS